MVWYGMQAPPRAVSRLYFFSFCTSSSSEGPTPFKCSYLQRGLHMLNLRFYLNNLYIPQIMTIFVQKLILQLSKASYQYDEGDK